MKDHQIPLEPPSNGNYGYNSGAMLGQALASFQSPAATLMLAEMPATWNVLGNGNGSLCYGPGGASDTGAGFEKGQQSGGILTAYHTERWNYAFVDGHVKSLRPLETVGKGIGGTGQGQDSHYNHGDPYTCSADTPCGMWTARDDD